MGFIYMNKDTDCYKAVQRLADYEDIGTVDELMALKEQNEALKTQLEDSVQLPCKVGDTVWAIAKCMDIKRKLDGSYYSSVCGEEECNEQDYAIFESVVEGLNYFAEHNRWELYLDNLDDFESYHLTKPAAEARLKELEVENGK